MGSLNAMFIFRGQCLLAVDVDSHFASCSKSNELAVADAVRLRETEKPADQRRSCDQQDNNGLKDQDHVDGNTRALHAGRARLKRTEEQTGAEDTHGLVATKESHGDGVKADRTRRALREATEGAEDLVRTRQATKGRGGKHGHRDDLRGRHAGSFGGVGVRANGAQLEAELRTLQKPPDEPRCQDREDNARVEREVARQNHRQA